MIQQEAVTGAGRLQPGLDIVIATTVRMALGARHFSTKISKLSNAGIELVELALGGCIECGGAA